MIEPVVIKTKQLMFYCDELIEFRGIGRSFDFWRLYTNVKFVLREISSAFSTLIGIGGVVALVYFFQLKGQLRESPSPERVANQLGGSKSTPMCIYKF